jgi:ABC-type bacteriocin/lantibiotic exporter with double-glycine peptidase domain
MRIGVNPTPAAQRSFALEKVSFRHAKESPEVISDASFRLEHPAWLALVGSSGAGKSTLIELLCGVNVPQSGKVVHAWPVRPDGSTSPCLAYLPQHVALLDGSVMDNVVFGFDQGDVERVDEALGLACLDGVVASLPEGRDAQIGADGARLSGGERQRLALARALYRRPDLLLLDEATSGLDEATESRLLSAIREQRPQMSVVYITHRSSNLRFADQVLRLQGGFLSEVSVKSPDHE